LNDNVSLCNTAQCEKASDLATGLINNIKVSANDIIIITPYRGNLESLEQTQKVKATNTPADASIGINTTDSFQGHDAYIVILVLIVNMQTPSRTVY
jgi:superfamily I DNA and/or RNA helicase